MAVPMAVGRPKAALVLSAEQRAQLESMASSRSLPAGLVTRVRIVLLSAAGKMNQQIARQLGLTNAIVGKGRRRFVEQGVAGLHDELRPGRPRPISDEQVARLVRKTLETKPKDGTHWTSDRWQTRHGYRNRRSTASGRSSGWNHTGSGISSSRPIHF